MLIIKQSLELSVPPWDTCSNTVLLLMIAFHKTIIKAVLSTNQNENLKSIFKNY